MLMFHHMCIAHMMVYNNRSMLDNHCHWSSMKYQRSHLSLLLMYNNCLLYRNVLFVVYILVALTVGCKINWGS